MLSWPRCSKQTSEQVVPVLPSLHRTNLPAAIGLALLVLACTVLPSPPAVWETRAPPDDSQGRGANVADLKNASLLPEIGFEWLKSFVFWSRSQLNERGRYRWHDLDKALGTAARSDLRLLLRVDQAPLWTHPDNTSHTAPPDEEHLQAWGDFLEAMARHARGRVDAYEIWNEPNLASEWGDEAPDPAYYARMLAIAYERIHRADPQALVVSAGFAPTLGGNGNMGNLEYLQALYDVGGPRCDVLGSHPYGYASPPDADPYAQASFREAEKEYAIASAHDDGSKRVWATEFGWMLTPESGGHSECRDYFAEAGRWYGVSAQEQAQYLVQAFEYASAHWPWMGVMFVFNLDFAAAPWYTDPCDPMTYESLLAPDGSPRPAFNAMKSAAGG